MHYKNGREAKNGDKIILLNQGGNPFVGILFDAKAEAGSDCNGSIASIVPFYSTSTADLKNCLHLDDIALAKIPDSTQSNGISTGISEDGKLSTP